MTEDGTLVAPHLLGAKQLRILCLAVLDAAEYRKRVEAVAKEMRRYPNAELMREWGAQLTTGETQ